ncbi:TPA: hypothetical protein QCR61_004579 [Bacillus cereus]|nr:hypothetical protein [Bacillus cereus]
MKKPFYKKWWFWGIIIFFILGIAGTHDKKEKEKKNAAKEVSVENKQEKKKEESKQETKHVEKENKKQDAVKEETSNDKDKDQLEKQSKNTIKAQDETKVKKATIDEYKGRINQAFKEMGRKTNLKINSTNVLEDGRTVINLSDNILIFLTTDKDQYIEKATLGMTTDAYLLEHKDFEFAFLLLIGTIDDTLNYSERYLVKQELGLSDKDAFNKQFTKTYKRNGIAYTFKGGIKDNFILQAEIKK